MGTGRPITTEVQQQIKAMAAAGKSRPEILTALGVSRSTVTKYAPDARRLRAPTRGAGVSVSPAETARVSRTQRNGTTGVRTLTATIVPTGQKTYLVVLPGWGVLVGRRATLKV